MISYKRLTKNGLSMFKEALHNLEEANRIMNLKKEKHLAKIDNINMKLDEINTISLENERVVNNIRKIIE